MRRALSRTAVMTATPRSAPVTPLRPPTTSMTSVSSVYWKKKNSGRRLPISYTRSEAATATTATDSRRAIVCWTTGLMPMARAARLSSRAAWFSRPMLLRANSRASTMAANSAR